MSLRIIRVRTACAAACVVGAAVCGTSNSQQPEPASKPAQKLPMSPAAKALEVLKVDEGNWDAVITFWFKPGGEPTKSRALLKAKMDLDGMFLEQRFDGAFGPEMGNKPWTSLSYTGFNPTTGQYEAVRMASSHSTMIVVRGKAKPDGSIELAGEYMFMGGKATERDVIRHEGADKCIIECWMSFGDVPEYKGAEMVLTRAK
jgi:Protein of unknown function (DUF1579)